MNIFGGFQNNEYFWRSSQNWTGFRGHFYAISGLFFKVNVQNGIIFGGC